MNQTIAVLKKKMEEKPWLYEDEEKAVLSLLEEAIIFIRATANSIPSDDMDGGPADAQQWLDEHGIS